MVLSSCRPCCVLSASCAAAAKRSLRPAAVCCGRAKMPTIFLFREFCRASVLVADCSLLRSSIICPYSTLPGVPRFCQSSRQTSSCSVNTHPCTLRGVPGFSYVLRRFTREAGTRRAGPLCCSSSLHHTKLVACNVFFPPSFWLSLPSAPPVCGEGIKLQTRRSSVENHFFFSRDNSKKHRPTTKPRFHRPLSTLATSPPRALPLGNSSQTATLESPEPDTNPPIRGL